MEFRNVYEDTHRAAAYDQLEFPGTYHLAFRDLPAILRDHASGLEALDFGCGTGRSTRFLKGQGLRAIGIDISSEMVARARARDPSGDYRVVADGDFDSLPAGGFDLVLCAFPFDNIPERDRKVHLFRGLRGLLAARGRIVNIVSAPEIYTHEWASFTTKAFPENRRARSGDVVRIIMTDIPDARPVEDVVWSDEAYRDVFRCAGLRAVSVHRPLARGDEPFGWVSETAIAPWTIYVLAAEAGEQRHGAHTSG